MRGSKRETDQVSGTSCVLKKGAGSKPVELQLKKSDNSSSCRKQKSQSETVATIAAKRKFPCLSGKVTGNGTRSRKPNSRKIKHQTLNSNFSKKLTSPTQGRKPSQEKEGNEQNTNKEVNIRKLKKRGKNKKRKQNVELDEASRLQRRTRYLLIKIKLEQNLIDAYSAEGWKGQSREKIKPDKELERAKKQILKCKIGIREAIHQLDLLGSVGSIEDSVIAADGSVHHEHIFCAKCKSRETSPDNDIILCDGTCNCAFHQKCLDPPLNTENSDQGWLCKVCECKVEILEAINAHLGTHFSITSNWQDIFKEEAAYPLDGESLFLEQEVDLPSDDSEDDDYDPDKSESSCSINSERPDNYSLDSTTISTSLDWCSDSEVKSGFRLSDTDMGVLDSDEAIDAEILCGRRQRSAVDYIKLNDEMFGKDAAGNEQVSEDEDWGPDRRKRRKRDSDAACTLINLHESKEKGSDAESSGVENKSSTEPRVKRPCFRIPPNAVEKLRQVFSENELPPKAVRDDLSKELGLNPEKVSKWFKNARYIALKTRKAQDGKQVDSSVPQATDGAILSNVTLAETAITKLKSSRRVRQRKATNSANSPSSRKCRKRTAREPSANSIKDNVEFSDDISLKNLLKASFKRKRRKDAVRDGTQEVEITMERLCQLKCKVESMRERLRNIQTSKTKKVNECEFYRKNVIYVPVAELKEKS